MKITVNGCISNVSGAIDAMGYNQGSVTIDVSLEEQSRLIDLLLENMKLDARLFVFNPNRGNMAENAIRHKSILSAITAAIMMHEEAFHHFSKIKKGHGRKRK